MGDPAAIPIFAVPLVFACPTECLWVAAQAWLSGPVQTGRRKLGGGRMEEGCDALQAGGGVLAGMQCSPEASVQLSEVGLRCPQGAVSSSVELG